MKLLLLNCVLVLGLLSCKTTQNILGEYGSIVNDHSTFVIKLLDSSKFEYKCRLGLSEKYSYGTFKYKKGNLILISNPDITNENGSVRAEFSEHTDGFILKFFYFDGIRPFKNLDILINDSIKMKTDENGVVKYYGSLSTTVGRITAISGSRPTTSVSVWWRVWLQRQTVGSRMIMKQAR